MMRGRTSRVVFVCLAAARHTKSATTQIYFSFFSSILSIFFPGVGDNTVLLNHDHHHCLASPLSCITTVWLHHDASLQYTTMCMRDVYNYVCMHLIVAMVWRTSVACPILSYRLVQGQSSTYRIEARLYQPLVSHHVEYVRFIFHHVEYAHIIGLDYTLCVCTPKQLGSMLNLLAATQAEEEVAGHDDDSLPSPAWLAKPQV